MRWLARLSPRESRLLSILILALLLWFFFAFLVTPLTEAQSSLSDEIEAARHQLGRLDAVLSRSEKKQATAGSQQSQSIWSGASPSVVAANVQKQIQTEAQKNRIEIVSISQTQSRFSENLQTVGLVIEGHGEISAFVDLFATLERNRPVLFVDKFMLRRYQAPGGFPPGARLPLAARFEIHAPHRLGEKG